MKNEILGIKKKLGSDLLILAHHYQSDDIVSLADNIGDSLKLAQIAEQNKTAKYIVFCGVHFMAETADILTEDDQIVLMPDSNAGCPMADMADDKQLETAWGKLTSLIGDSILPITYINSKAVVKSFCGAHGGTTVTSSNAKKVVSWGMKQKDVILFLPDKNLGRNTAFELGIPLENMAEYDPLTSELSYTCDLKDIRVVLWKGYCHVHNKVDISKVEYIRKNYPDMKIIIHPECTHEVVSASDMAGSTEYIINNISSSPSGSSWAVGTETNLVNRLIAANPDKKIVILDKDSSCTDMNATTLSSLLDTLKDIENNDMKRKVTVPKEISENAKKALSRMLSL